MEKNVVITNVSMSIVTASVSYAITGSCIKGAMIVSGALCGFLTGGAFWHLAKEFVFSCKLSIGPEDPPRDAIIAGVVAGVLSGYAFPNACGYPVSLSNVVVLIGSLVAFARSRKLVLEHFPSVEKRCYQKWNSRPDHIL